MPIRLLPNAQGGLRPIALFRSWFRLSAACQRESQKSGCQGPGYRHEHDTRRISDIGILAGAMAAPYDMLVFSIDRLAEIREMLPSDTEMTLHVDDLNLTVSARAQEEAFLRPEQATMAVCQVFERDRLQVEKKKLFFVISCENLGG